MSQYDPVPLQASLKAQYIGQPLQDVPVPSLVLDLAPLRRNCQRMLNAISELQLKFRAHVKTHKTAELMRLQVGEHSKDVRIIVSTVLEAEFLCDTLAQYQASGASVSVLYGVPIGPSQIPRLAALSKRLGPGAVAAMIDNPAQIESVRLFKAQAGTPLSVFVKTDSGYHRAGIAPESATMMELVRIIGDAESQGDVSLLGFYSHNSLSYGGSSPDDAMDMLKVEIDVCRQAAQQLLQSQTPRSKPLTISVGASPTALSILNILPSSTPSSTSPSAKSLIQTLHQPSTPGSSFEIEIHAGVYPTFDLQQVAASSTAFPSLLAPHSQIALTVLTEVISTYPTRTSSPEALVSAGTLALGREPCKSYSGWGVVTAWNMPQDVEGSGREYTEEMAVDASSRIIVSRISQEHGIIGWESKERHGGLPVVYGQRVRIWPNHACITGAGFESYLIVDSEREGAGGSVGGDEVVDVWVRQNGW